MKLINQSKRILEEDERNKKNDDVVGVLVSWWKQFNFES